MTDRAALARLSPADLRALIRAGDYRGVTSGLAPGVLQGNLVVLPTEAADDFAAFCAANPAALPVIERGRPGDPRLTCATGFDVRTDLPGYQVWRDGAPAEQRDEIADLWSADLTAFLLGCWFANEAALAAAGIRLRHVERGVQGALFRTNRAAVPAGRFAGPEVVSMRPFATEDVPRIRVVTAARPQAHGAPLSADAAALGVDLTAPDWGDALPPEPGETALFWPCGLTGQEALAAARLPFFLTHRPGCMAVTDLPAEPA
ncbi:MAG: DUF1445 domain-containing protein [Pseudomonadota bacterium]|nr:DUF1445 domain-containing protein [Pseudomonadota bacterium]MEE3098736.1 DUF1445 domain-containing protein [Pseudomonadota bacterium]